MKIRFDKDLKITGYDIVLRILNESDLQNAIEQAGDDESRWEHTSENMSSKEGIERWFAQAVKDFENHIRLSFAVICNGKFAGSSSMANISERDSRLEIGWTWYGKDYAGTGINPKVKMLLLRYAFEVLGAERVEFKTDVFNLRSRKALKKIGATEEGILRSHMETRTGRRRDSVYFSIIKGEWQEVKHRLTELINS